MVTALVVHHRFKVYVEHSLNVKIRPQLSQETKNARSHTPKSQLNAPVKPGRKYDFSSVDHEQLTPLFLCDGTVRPAQRLSARPLS